jgi:2-hydroxy-3-keto-5-methylthiopentenyl-1-phosphate phosphatase
VRLPVVANPGHIRHGRLNMERPSASPFCGVENGIDKAAVVDALTRDGRHVAFAGDGFPDLPAARLVSAERRFARGDLAHACRENELAYQPFEQWVEVVDALVQQPFGRRER